MRTHVLKQAVVQRTSPPSNEPPMNGEMRSCHLRQATDAEPKPGSTGAAPCHELISYRLDQVQRLHDLLRDSECRLRKRANLSHMSQPLAGDLSIDIPAQVNTKIFRNIGEGRSLRQRQSGKPGAHSFEVEGLRYPKQLRVAQSIPLQVNKTIWPRACRPRMSTSRSLRSPRCRSSTAAQLASAVSAAWARRRSSAEM